MQCNLVRHLPQSLQSTVNKGHSSPIFKSLAFDYTSSGNARQLQMRTKGSWMSWKTNKHCTSGWAFLVLCICPSNVCSVEVVCICHSWPHIPWWGTGKHSPGKQGLSECRKSHAQMLYGVVAAYFILKLSTTFPSSFSAHEAGMDLLASPILPAICARESPSWCLSARTSVGGGKVFFVRFWSALLQMVLMVGSFCIYVSGRGGKLPKCLSWWQNCMKTALI